MPNTIYEVELPDGKILEIEAPKGTSPQVIRQRAQQYQSQGETYDPTEGMSRLDKLLVGAGRGFTELGQGVKQAAYHVGGALGLKDQGDVKAYDQAISDEAAQYERDLGNSGWANAGRIGSQIAATAPLGAIGAGAKGAAAIARAGAIQGAAGAALNPVTSGDGFAAEKAKQVALGAGTGAALNVGGAKLMDKAMGVANAPRKAVNSLLAPQSTPGQASVVQRIATGTPAQIRKGDRIADATGINLSPGQRSGGKAVTMAENVARGSIWTRDKMFAGDQMRARQMLNSIRRTARQASPDGTSAEAWATHLQGTVKNMVTDLADARSKFGRQAYGAIENAAGGQKVVATNRTLDTIAGIVDEFGGVQGSDA